MTPSLAAPLPRLGALALAAALCSACTVVGDGLLSGEKVDYRNTPVKAQPLEVPPDLSQLARESRYQAQGGVVSAAAAAAPAASGAGTAAPGAQPTVALDALAGMRIQREGQLRWLVVPIAPEQLWPQLRAFWEKNGFQLSTDSAAVGVMETTWAENRARIGSADAPRGIISRIMGSFTDTGERDRYRTRVERSAAGGAEVYITHRGIEEVYSGERQDGTTWRVRPSDPQLEAEFLARLMLALGAKDEPARAAVAAAVPASAAPAPAGAASAAKPASGIAALVLSEPFDRAWRRVGLALDRSGFTVEDRDRAAGLYYVRYVDPKNVGKEEPSWWARLWGDKSNPQEALRYRVAVKAGGDKTTVTVQNSAGATETGDNAQRIMGMLAGELR